jgi:taurine dioxygenase
MQQQKLGAHMAVAVEGVDLAQSTAETQGALVAALHDNLVLCIRDQKLAPVAFRDAMARFGTPVKRLQLATTPECDEVNIISSEDRDVLGDGKKLVNGASWHTDDSFMRAPCSLTMLYGVIVPSRGGDTQFTNMYAAYEALAPAMKARIGGLKVIHKYQSNRRTNRVSQRPASEMAAMPEAIHPLVRTHPETGRKALYLNANRMEQVVGLERAESDALLDALITHAIEPRFQYRHAWRQGDVVIWDNRCTMHKANADYPEGERRLMHRVVVASTAPA